MVLEVMGRDTGWLAVVGGMAGGADFIAIPEVPIHIDYIVEHATERMATHRFSVMAIAEGTQIAGLVVPEGAGRQVGRVRARAPGRKGNRPARRRRDKAAARASTRASRCWATSSGAALPRCATATAARCWARRPSISCTATSSAA